MNAHCLYMVGEQPCAYWGCATIRVPCLAIWGYRMQFIIPIKQLPSTKITILYSVTGFAWWRGFNNYKPLSVRIRYNLSYLSICKFNIIFIYEIWQRKDGIYKNKHILLWNVYWWILFFTFVAACILCFLRLMKTIFALSINSALKYFVSSVLRGRSSEWLEHNTVPVMAQLLWDFR